MKKGGEYKVTDTNKKKIFKGKVKWFQLVYLKEEVRKNENESRLIDAFIEKQEMF